MTSQRKTTSQRTGNPSPFSTENLPNIQILSPTIKTDLIQNTNKKNTDVVSLMNIAQSYPENWIHINTEGSAFKSTMNAGYGACVQLPDQ